MSKPHIEYTIGDLIRLEGGFLKRYYCAEELVTLVHDLKYLEKAASEGGSSISAFSAMELGVVVLEEGIPLNRLTDDRNEILARVLEQVQDPTLPSFDKSKHKKSVEGFLSGSEIKLLKSTGGGHLSNMKSKIRDGHRTMHMYEDDIESLKVRIEEKEASIFNCQKSIAEQEEVITFLYNKSLGIKDVSPEDKFRNEINKIQQLGSWNLIGVSLDRVGHLATLLFEPKDDITMRMFNPAIDLDDEINFGKLRLRVNIVENSARVYRGRNALLCSGYFHANVSIGGNICYGGGSLGQDLKWAIERGDLFEYVEGMRSLLTTYSNETPHMTHSSFVDKAFRIADKSAKYCHEQPLSKLYTLPLEDYSKVPKVGEKYILKGLSDSKENSSRTKTLEVLRKGGTYVRFRGEYTSIPLSEFLEEYKPYTGEENGTEDLHTAESEGENTVLSGQSGQGDTGPWQVPPYPIPVSRVLSGDGGM